MNPSFITFYRITSSRVKHSKSLTPLKATLQKFIMQNVYEYLSTDVQYIFMIILR